LIIIAFIEYILRVTVLFIMQKLNDLIFFFIFARLVLRKKSVSMRYSLQFFISYTWERIHHIFCNLNLKFNCTSWKWIIKETTIRFLNTLFRITTLKISGLMHYSNEHDKKKHIVSHETIFPEHFWVYMKIVKNRRIVSRLAALKI